MQIRDQEKHLRRVLEQYGKVAVAFSGGADSSLVLWHAVKVLGPENVVALTSRTCLLKPHELEKVSAWFADHGLAGSVSHEFIDIDPLGWKDFVQNPPDRCYHCKYKVYNLFLARAEDLGISRLLDGTNSDDMLSDRPGLRALRQLNIGIPLAEAGLSKKDVRILGREAGLNNWNRPSSSCLATRIPAGMMIDARKIDLVFRAESVLEKMGFAGCRVRLDLDDAAAACIQVQEQDLPLVALDGNRSYLLERLNEFGFSRVLLDMCGR